MSRIILDFYLRQYGEVAVLHFFETIDIEVSFVNFLYIFIKATYDYMGTYLIGQSEEIYID